MKDSFIEEYIRIKKERKFSTEDMSEILGINADALEKYESGIVPPSYNFIKKLIEHFEIGTEDLNFENIFTQGYFGNMIPLITEYDLINDCDNHVIYHMELPQLERYGENKLFAIKYNGGDVPEFGILRGSVLVFVTCEKMTRDGVYAVVKRDAFKFEVMRHVDGEMRIETLNGLKNRPRFAKSASARGRMVCCINTYEDNKFLK